VRTAGHAGFLSTLTRRPVVRLVALVTILTQIGCYVTERRPIPTPIAVTDSMVVPWLGQDVSLLGASMEGDSVLVGSRLLALRPGEPPTTTHLRIPIEELYEIERRYSGGATAATAALCVGLVVGALAFLVRVSWSN
jgi:hypothetical protein